MLGSDLVKYFSNKFVVTAINKDNYQAQIGKNFNVLINANGNSRRFWANKNPVEDFFASTVSVIKSIFDFPCDMYIYISSPDVYENHTKPRFTKENGTVNPEKLDSYGLHKYLSELIVKKYKEKYLILRPAMILGSNLKKGPIFDLLNDKALFITSRTKLQTITTRAIAEVIETLLNKSVTNQALNVGGKDTVSFLKLSKLNKKIKFSPEAKLQTYEMDIAKIKRIYPRLKTSEDYLEGFLYNSLLWQKKTTN